MPRSQRIAAKGLSLGLALLGLSSPMALAQSTAAKPARPVEEVATIGQGGRPTPGGLVPAAMIKASARAIGTPSPGLRMTLDGSASSGARNWVRWIQTQGPKATIDDPTRAEAHFIVPADSKVLAFVLVVGDRTGVDAQGVTIEVEDPASDSDERDLKADAGDDQPGKVGRRVILNGTRSEPKGRIKFRWLQAGGPKVVLNANDGATCSFVPTTPGTYQFALLVASEGGLLSEPSVVTIDVAGSGRASAGSTEARTMALDELARVSLSSIDGGPRYADELSRAFDAVADRMDGFKTYSDAIDETTKRLDAVVPRDKDRRAIWVEQLFSPLMLKVATGMRVEGLDLSQRENQGKPMTRPQKARLAEQFRYTAAGLRSARTIR